MDDLNFLKNSFDAVTTLSEGAVVVLVEDDDSIRITIKNFLEKKLQYQVLSFSNPHECLEKLDLSKFKSTFCLLTDLGFKQGLDGLLLIDMLKERGGQFFSLVMTGFGTIETAIAATKKGVFQYLTKPFSIEVLAKTLEDGFALYGRKKAILGNEIARNVPDPTEIFCGMIGRSAGMQVVFERIKKVASSDSTILITGPSGTGKELVAHAIHQLSSRAAHHFLPVNCGSIPKDLLESELFGHLKGSFTGAIANRKGRFELAEKGTLFLDEIGDMPFSLQVKLLRVLQKKEIEPIGGNTPIKIDVRIVAATHRNLEKLSEEGHFREDLFYRLNVIPIKIPALSQRKEDIPLLIEYFLSRIVSANKSNGIEIDPEAFELLLNYEWPGNVRELENLIERLVILRGGNLIRPEDLPSKIYRPREKARDFKTNLYQLPDDGIDLKKTLTEIEKALIAQALGRTQGNKNQASKILGINRTTLIEKIKKLEMNL